MYVYIYIYIDIDIKIYTCQCYVFLPYIIPTMINRTGLFGSKEFGAWDHEVILKVLVSM